MWTQAAVYKALRKHKKLRLFVENDTGTVVSTSRWRYVTLKSCKYRCVGTMDHSLASCFRYDIEGKPSGIKIIKAMWDYDQDNDLKVTRVYAGRQYRKVLNP